MKDLIDPYSIRAGGLRGSFLFFLIFLFSLPLLNAQSINPAWPEPAAVSTEIERLEMLASNPAQRQEALIQLARLYQLLGNREKALELWTAVSAAAPGARNDKALLEAVKLLISMGEFDKAAAELRNILMTNRTQDIQLSAWHLNAQLEIFRSGNYEPLNQLAGIPDFSNVHSRILYTLWRVCDDASWRTSLINLYPRSVEAGIAGENPGIKAVFTPQWLLLPPREELTIAAAAPAPAAAVSAPPSVPQTQSTSVMLQAGLFSREDNALALAERLNTAGFSSEITRRSLDSGDFWAVNVPSDNNVNQTIARLKSAGFDAFPVN